MSMTRKVTLTLESVDVCQLLDALESRAAAYEKTKSILNGTAFRKLKKIADPDERNKACLELYFWPEEARSAREAKEIAEHFRDIIAKINQQLDTPSPQPSSDLVNK